MAVLLTGNEMINRNHIFVTAVNYDCEYAVVRAQEDLFTDSTVLFITGYRLVPGNITYPKYPIGLTVFHSVDEVTRHTDLPIRIHIPNYSPDFRIYLHKTDSWWSNELKQLPEEVTPLAYKTINLLLT